MKQNFLVCLTCFPFHLLFHFKIPAVSLQEVLLEEQQQQQQQERKAGQRNSL